MPSARPSPFSPDSAASLPAGIRAQAASWKARADAGMNPEEDRALQAWLGEDPRHRAALARLDTVMARFDQPHASGATATLLAALEQRARQRRGRRLAFAASTLAVLVCAGLWWRPAVLVAPLEADPRATTAAAVPANDAPQGSPQLRLPPHRTLPDGSVVELAGDAEIQVDYSAAVRRLVLQRGELHVQVVKDPSRPFVVVAGGVEARAVGTAFAVQFSPQAVEVLVTEGTVAVQSVAPTSLAQPEQPSARLPGPVTGAASGALPAPLPAVLVGKGQRVQLAVQPAPDQRPAVVSVSATEIDQRLAWRAPRMEFSRTPLAEAVAVLNGYAAGHRVAGERCVQLVLDDPTLASVRVSGLFRIDRTDVFVTLLRSGFGIEAVAQGPDTLLLRRLP